ncbi:Uncharacterised protein [Mycobacteroides abscessus subsp. abscessus]|nr:Uncharacterised protein [Mycobacteroides abscessus subsp. abscessus]
MVTCSKSSPRSRYARESPMWATSIWSPSTSSAVQVVPIPASSGFSSTSWLRMMLAVWISSARYVPAEPW